MPTTLPIEMQVEYRGQAPGGDFTDRATGESVAYGPRLKFEYEDERGDVMLVPVRQADLDRCEPPFDASTLQKGDVVIMRGRAVLADRGSGKDSYFALSSVRLAGADAAPIRDAKAS